MKPSALLIAVVITCSASAQSTYYKTKNGTHQALTEEQKQTIQKAIIAKRLKGISIPAVNFEEVTVEDAIDFLRAKAQYMIKNSEGKEISQRFNFIIIDPKHKDAKNPPSLRVIQELRLENIPADALLNYICEMTGLRWKIEPHAIVIR